MTKLIFLLCLMGVLGRRLRAFCITVSIYKQVLHAPLRVHICHYHLYAAQYQTHSNVENCHYWVDLNPRPYSPKSDALTTVAKWLDHQTLVNMVWVSNSTRYQGVTILNMMQVSLATCCEFATGLHIVGSGKCALLAL